jgi:hypothetical protein
MRDSLVVGSLLWRHLFVGLGLWRLDPMMAGPSQLPHAPDPIQLCTSLTVSVLLDSLEEELPSRYSIPPLHCRSFAQREESKEVF